MRFNEKGVRDRTPFYSSNLRMRTTNRQGPQLPEMDDKECIGAVR